MQILKFSIQSSCYEKNFALYTEDFEHDTPEYLSFWWKQEIQEIPIFLL